MNQTSPLVITISRQLGSGGAYIGQRLAKELNIYYADREIIKKAAEHLSMTEDELVSQEEKTPSMWEDFWQVNAYTPDFYWPPLPNPIPTSLDVYMAEKNVIEQITREHSAVITGRCGSYILREHPNMLSIFLHGNVASRKRRVQEMYKISESEAEQKIAQSDKQRAMYIDTFTGMKWNDATQYDLSINTSNLELDACVELILNYVKSL